MGAFTFTIFNRPSPLPLLLRNVIWNVTFSRGRTLSYPIPLPRNRENWRTSYLVQWIELDGLRLPFDDRIGVHVSQQQREAKE